MPQFMPILFDASIKGLAVLLLAWGITLAMRRGSAAARHMVWSGAIIATLAMPALSLLLPGLPFLPRIDWLTEPTTSTPATSGAQVQPSEGDSASALQGLEEIDQRLWSRDEQQSDLAGDGFVWPDNGEVTSDTTAPVEPLAFAPPESPGAAEPPILSQPTETTTAANAPATSPAQSTGPSWRFWVPRIWLAGCVLALLPLVLGWLSLWQLRRTATRVTAGPWHALLQQLAGEMQHAHPVVLLKSPCRSMPMTWGALAGLVPQWCAGLPGGAAVLLVPDDADDWSPQRQRAVLLHELAHIKRRDCLALLLTQLACAVYWFNPLVWLAARHMLIERERACDDMVLIRDTKASDYAQHLLDIATAPQAIQPGFFASQAGIAMARKSKLDGRLVAILDQHRNRKALTRAGALCTAGAIAVVTLLVACMRAEDAPVASRYSTTGSALDLELVAVRPDGDDEVFSPDGVSLGDRPDYVFGPMTWEPDQMNRQFIFEGPALAAPAALATYPEVRVAGTDTGVSMGLTFYASHRDGGSRHVLNMTFEQQYRAASGQMEDVERLDITLRFWHGPRGAAQMSFEGPFAQNQATTTDHAQPSTLRVLPTRGDDVTLELVVPRGVRVEEQVALIYDTQGHRHQAPLHGSSQTGVYKISTVDVPLSQIAAVTVGEPTRTQTFNNVVVAYPTHPQRHYAPWVDDVAAALDRPEVATAIVAGAKWQDVFTESAEALSVIHLVRGSQTREFWRMLREGKDPIHPDFDVTTLPELQQRQLRSTLMAWADQQRFPLRAWSDVEERILGTYGLDLGLAMRWSEFVDPALDVLEADVPIRSGSPDRTLTEFTPLELSDEQVRRIEHIMVTTTQPALLHHLMFVLRSRRGNGPLEEAMVRLAKDADEPWVWWRVLNDTWGESIWRDLPANELTSQLMQRKVLVAASRNAPLPTDDAQLIEQAYRMLPEIVADPNMVRMYGGGWADAHELLVQHATADVATEAEVRWLRDLDEPNRYYWSVGRVTRAINRRYDLDLAALGTDAPIEPDAQVTRNWADVKHAVVDWYTSTRDPVAMLHELKAQLIGAWRIRPSEDSGNVRSLTFRPDGTVLRYEADDDGSGERYFTDTYEIEGGVIRLYPRGEKNESNLLVSVHGDVMTATYDYKGGETFVFDRVEQQDASARAYVEAFIEAIKARQFDKARDMIIATAGVRNEVSDLDGFADLATWRIVQMSANPQDAVVMTSPLRGEPVVIQLHRREAGGEWIIINVGQLEPARAKDLYDRISADADMKPAFGAGQLDPVSLLPGMQARFVAISKAIDSGDSAAALRILEAGVPDLQNLVAALEGSPAQQGVRTAAEMIDQVRDALKAGNMNEARALLQGVGVMAAELGKVIREPATVPSYDAASLTKALEGLLATVSELAENQSARALPMSVEALLTRYPKLWTSSDYTQRSMSDAIDVLGDIPREMPSLIKLIVSQYRDDQLDDVQFVAGQRVLNAYIREIADARKPKSSAWSETVNGLQARVVAPEDTYISEDTPNPSIRVDVKNVSAVPVPLTNINTEPRFRGAARGSNLDFNATASKIAPWAMREGSLKPGQTISWTLHLRDIPDLISNNESIRYDLYAWVISRPWEQNAPMGSEVVECSALRVVVDAPRDRIDDASDWPETWNESLELVMRLRAGPWEMATITIDGSGKLTLLQSAQMTEAVTSRPRGRYRRMLTREQLDALAKVMHDAEVWKLTTTPRMPRPSQEPAPPTTDAPWVNIVLRAGLKTLTNPDWDPRRSHASLKATHEAVIAMLKDVEAQLEPDNVWTPAATAGPAKDAEEVVDPVSLLPGLKTRIAAVMVAMRGKDASAALPILEHALSDMRKLVVALEDSSAQQNARAGVEMMEQLRDSLQAGTMDEVLALLLDIDANCTELEQLIRKTEQPAVDGGRPKAPVALANLPLRWGQAVEGLQVGLAIPQQPMVAGQPYEVRWAIRNTGDVPRTIVWHEHHYSPVYFEVGAKGEVARIRNDVRRAFNDRNPAPPTAIVLQPGQSKEATFDLSWFLDRDRRMNPGDYEVRGLYFPSNKQGASFPVEYLKQPELKDAVVSLIDSATLSFKVVAADAAGAGAQTPLADLPLRWGQAVEGLQVGLAIPQQPMVAGQPYKVRWAIRNVGDVPRTIAWHELQWSPVFFEVGGKGQVATIRARYLVFVSKAGPPSAVVLEPGQSKESTFDLTHFQPNSMNPGDYEVRGLYYPSDKQGATFPVEYLKRPEFKDAVVSRIDSATLAFKVVAAAPLPATAPTAPAGNEESAAME